MRKSETGNKIFGSTNKKLQDTKKAYDYRKPFLFAYVLNLQIK